MSTRALDASTHVRPDEELARSRGVAVCWLACLGVCLAFWWFVLTALLG
jgi:hypothetical protein